MREINAEMMLEELYPELEQLWTVKHKSTFFRNYNADVIEMYGNLDSTPQNKDPLNPPTVEVSRDGILKLLPTQILSPSWELADEDVSGKKFHNSKETRYEEMKKRLHLLSEAFIPIDTFHFRNRLKLERHVEEILDLKLWFVLKKYYDFDLNEEHDELVTEAAMLLPYITKLRGNKQMAATVLSVITGYEVRVRQSAYSHTDNSRHWMPKLNYDIIIPGLSAKEYKEQTERLTPIIEFVREHFIPFDVFCDIEIKDSQTASSASINSATTTASNRNADILLNYNTHV